MPLQRVHVPPSQEVAFNKVLGDLTRLSGSSDAVRLFNDVDRLLNATGDDYPDFGATLRYEAARAVLDLHLPGTSLRDRALHYLRDGLALMDPMQRPLERALALIALSQASPDFFHGAQTQKQLREAVDLLAPLPEELDQAIARELLADSLAPSRDPQDLRDAISQANEAITIRRRHHDVWSAVRMARLEGQLALRMVDLGFAAYLRLAFECQAEASSAYNQVTPIDETALMNHASAVVDLAEVCFVGVEIADPTAAAALRDEVGKHPFGPGDDELSRLLPLALSVFQLLKGHEDVAASVLASQPAPLSPELKTILTDFSATAKELDRRSVKGLRNLRYTPGLVERVKSPDGG